MLARPLDRPTPLILVLLVLLSVVVQPAPAPVEAATLETGPSVDRDAVRSPYDRDGDGTQGELTAIRERGVEYRRRHAIGGELTSAQMLRRSRVTYEAWLRARNLETTKTITGDAWINLGPVNGAGRVAGLSPHPTDDDIVIAGSASGGVWKTIDRGLSWYPTTDGLPDLAVGAVAHAPSDPEIVYVGTGEGATFDIPGIGLLRSDDGGETWILPLDPADIMAEFFFDLSIHPTDPDRLIAGTNRGLIVSDDGGATWDIPIPASSSMRGITDVQRSASDPDLVYAALWCTSSACPSGLDRVMYSTDGGDTWESTGNDGLDIRTDSFLNTRISLAVAPSDDEILYVAANLPGNVNGYPYGNVADCGVFRSEDGGATWELTEATGPFLSPQGFYNNRVTVHPSDPDIALAAGVWYVRTEDGGDTWETLNPYQDPNFGQGSETVPHVDGHAWAWQGERLWMGNDGGVWFSDNNGADWTARNDGMVTRQNYGIAIDPVNRERVLGGTQDNGTSRRNDAGDDTWVLETGGDGGECAINPYINDTWYATSQFTNIWRRQPPSNTWKVIAPFFDSSEDAPFVTPLAMHPTRPNVMFTGTEDVWRSDNGGSSWFRLPTEVTNFVWGSGPVYAIATTAADPDRIMVSKGGTSTYTSRDGGRTWTWGQAGRRALNVEISPHDPEIALACMVASSSGAGGILRSTNGGANWTPSGFGLPAFNVQVARWDPTDPDVVYAGTDVGLYRSTDGGVNWARFGEGLPAASIHDIKILPDGSMLRIGTYGRGVWELEIDQPANQPPQVEITEPAGSVLVARVGDMLSLRAEASDPDGDPFDLDWLFTRTWTTLDGLSGVQGNATASLHTTLTQGGQYQVAAVVEDGRGGRATDWVTVVVSDPADSCDTPLVVPGDGPFPVTVVTSNALGTSQPSDPSPPCVDPTGQGGPDSGREGSTWFEFTPAESGLYALSTCGSAADTVLSVWTGDVCGPYTNVACNDDDEQEHCFGPRTDSYLELELEAETTYRAMVGSWISTSQDDFVFTVDCLSCVPSGQRLYLVPAAARTEGANDTTWLTDLQLLNPGESDAMVELSFLPSGSDNSEVPTIARTIPAGTAVNFPDVVATLFASEGSGAIRILSDSELVIASRTYNDAASGTFGQFIPGRAAETAVAPGGSVRLVGLVGNDDFRTNLGFANASDQPATFSLILRDADGEALVVRTEELPPFGWMQLNRVFDGEGSIAAGVADVGNDSEMATLMVYGSIVDGSTGDPTFVAPVAAVTATDPGWIAAAAHAEGFGSSVWRTDVFLANPGDSQVTATLEWYPPSGGPAASTTVSVPAMGSARLEDIVSTAFGAEGAGGIRVTVDAGELEVTSRTYNLAETGTYGQFIPAVLESAALAGGELAVLPLLRQDETFRTNVGVLNLGGETIEVAVEYFDADLGSLGTVVYTVGPFSWFQANGAPPAALAGGFARVASPTSGALFLVYGSVVDGGSDDPIYVSPTRLD